jgi:hypothetical protein
MKHIGAIFLTFYFLLIINPSYSQNNFAINWQKCLGGTQDDWVTLGNLIFQCSDGGFIIGASSASNDGDLTINYGNRDFWVVKLNSSGDLVWQKTFGSSSNEDICSIIETNDGGIVFVGGNLLYKLDGDGNIEWQYTSVNDTEQLRSVIQTSDLGFVVTAKAQQQINISYSDVIIEKIDVNGNLLWTHNYDGYNKDDYASEIIEIPSGELLFLGGAFSSNSKTDVWIMKLTANGILIWEKFYGSTGLYGAFDIENTTDGGFVFTGMKPGISWDPANAMIVKIDGLGNTVWEQIYGGNQYDSGRSIQQTTDGGFVITGDRTWSNNLPTHSSESDLWIAKLNSNGNILYEGVFGGNQLERGITVRTTLDNNFVVVGYVTSNDGDVVGYNEGNVWVVKFRESALALPEYLIDSEVKVIKVFDILGREIEPEANVLQFYQYSNGEIKRKIIIE